MNSSLTNYIKYCLGYVRLTRERTVAAQLKHTVNLPGEYFSLLGLLNGDTDGNLGELINLDTFYKYDPKDTLKKDFPKDEKAKYEKEKEFANRIEEIYSKYRNDQFTKQIIFNFGYFEVELPLIIDETIDPEGDEEKKELEPPKTKVDRYPLFALPVSIVKEIKGGAAMYFIYAVDSEIQVNIGILQSILGEELFFQLLEEMGKYEVDGQLSLPLVDLKVFTEIWHKIKAQLRLKEASFDEESFSLEEIKIALSPRANYFLAEDLAKLSQLTEEELEKTSLSSWTDDTELNQEGDLPQERELFFPFPYDKYQLATLSVLSNKASIIQGPPGTGKSETISNILCHLAATGKRVLFVSQKAQALKVVKDKLKKLNVKYLYGYLPNPASAQIGEEDEADGIGPQLSGLGAYIEKIGYKLNSKKPTNGGSETELPESTLNEVVGEKQRQQTAFNTAIDDQRRYYKLHQELKSLEEYDIGVTDFECFEASFSSAEWKKIKTLKKNREKLIKEVKKYERAEQKKLYDELYSSVDLNGKSYATSIAMIRDDVAKTGYDRHLNLLRKFNNATRSLRLGSPRSRLPREIVDTIDEILAEDISRNDAVKKLDSLYSHFAYYENLKNIESAEKEFEEKLATCGVADREFIRIDEKISNSDSEGLDEVKEKILRVQIIRSDLKTLVKKESTNSLGVAIKHSDEERVKRIAQYIQNIANRNIISKQGIAIRQIVQKLSKAFGKSKKAFKTFDNLRKDPDNFNAMIDLIPIWIMELDDASRIIPLQPGMFDYVILDEASQCNVAYTLPVMFRAHHALFVGDSEQMRDSTIMFKSNRVFDELARRYKVADERQIKATGNAVQSVLDIAKNRGFMYRTLRYHYRSPKELIDFSNEYFYKPNGKELIPLNTNYLTYKDTNRIMLIHEIQSDWKDEISDNVNVEEARAILALFKEMRDDDKYRTKSIGILTFFNAQASFIRELFEKDGLKEENDNYKISIIEGIQGDEKDIILYSFVIRSPDQRNKYMPLTGEGGDIRGDINKGRVNVAFSRARLQVHCFVSMSTEEMPSRIWLKKYLEYIQENGEVSFFSTDLKPFDSYFEEEFYGLIRANLKRGYLIQNQVSSCGFKIDFVITNVSSGKRIAIECDGPSHFKDEIDEAYGIHIESDEERQHVLEAAGWKFCRIKYADWINENFDRKVVVETVVEQLQ